MLGSKKKSHKILESSFYFVAGIVLTTIINVKLESILSHNIKLLIGFTVLTVMIAVYLFLDSRQVIEELADQMGATIQYVEEIYNSEIPYEGKMYQSMAKWISEAQFEVLTLAGTGVDGYQTGMDLAAEHDTRKKYLNTIIEQIEKNQNNEFKYVRIQQVANSNINKSIDNILEKSTTFHVKQILQIGQKFAPASSCTVSIMKIPTQRLSPFTIIDRKRLIIQNDGVDTLGRYGAFGQIFIEDRTGDITHHFIRYFSELERKAEEIDSSSIMSSNL